MISVGSSAGGGDALYLREVHTRTTPNQRPVAADQLRSDESSHTSLGRLLRLVADLRCDEKHMDAAIAHVNGSGKRVVSGVIDETPTPRAAFSLSDHRHISNLETVLRAADRAISELDAQPKEDSTASRNLLRALANTLVTQSVEECSSMKANLCVWTSQSKKRLRLLQWMLSRSPQAASVVLGDTVGVELLSQDPQAKTNQLTTCLVIFELAQRLRRGNRSGVTGDWVSLVDPLVGLTQRSTVITSTGVKPSKLGVVALDALLAVLCVAAFGSSSSERPVNATVLNGMELALQTLIQWNAQSSKRQWLLLAARQLLAVVSYWKHIESRDTDEMIAWHWNSSALWLCSRSDVVLAAKKQLASTTIRTIHDVYNAVVRPEAASGLKIKSAHSTVVMLRRLCILHGLQSGVVDELRKAVFADFEVTGKLLISLADALTAPSTRDLAIEMLRMYLLGKSRPDLHQAEPLLLLSDADRRAFISLIVKLNIEAGDSNSDAVLRFIAELCLTSGVSVMSRLQTSGDAAEIPFWLLVLGHALHQYQVVIAQDLSLCTVWLRDATLTVLQLVQHPDTEARKAALRMLSKLDLEVAMEAVGSTLLYEVDPKTSGGLVTLLFLFAENIVKPRTLELANVLIDTLQRGSTPSQQPIGKPSDVSQLPVLEEHAEEKRQALVMALSIQGWCSQATESTRDAVLSIQIGKVFASPRDPHPLSWLRELSLLGWFDQDLAGVLPIITHHMQGLEKLTETLLEDDSTQASKTVEQLLFARLAPNLVLRVIPRSAFHALYHRFPVNLLGQENGNGTPSSKSSCERILQDLATLLWSQVLHPLEFKDVKMLAIELLTKLPAQDILPHVLAQLHAFLREQGSPLAVLKEVVGDMQTGLETASGVGFVTAKLMMYYLNRLFTDDASGDSVRLADERTWTTLFTVLSLPCHPEESLAAQRSPLVDLQMGAIECLALLVSQSLSHRRAATGALRIRSIEDAVVDLILKVPDSTVPMDEPCHFSKWRATIQGVNEMRDNFSASQLQVCCCNVLLSTLSKLDEASLPGFRKHVLQRGILSALSLQRVHGSALAGCLQVAFSYVFRAGATLEQKEPTSAEIVSQSVSAVVDILHSSVAFDDQVYMSTLKLLGALIGKVSWLWPSLSSSKTSTQQDLAAGLRNLRDSPHDVSPPVRQLAQSLLQAMLPA